MEYAIDTRKVNRSLFAYRVVDIHNDEFGFAQDNVIYTYTTDSKSKSKGVTWLRMQRTGETGKDRRKYFLFFGDETEASAYVDKHNDIYDLEGNYVASLIRSRFIIFLILFIGAVIFFTGLAIYLGGSMIMDTTSPFSEDKTIHLEETDNTKGQGSVEQDIDIFDTGDDQETTTKAPVETTTKAPTKNTTEPTTEGPTDPTEPPTKPPTEPLTEPPTESNSKAHGGIFNKNEEKERLIYPGLSDEYVFYVQNDGDLPLNYQISLSEENVKDIPLSFKILVDGEYVLGDENTWADSSNYSAPNTEIDPGKVVEYKVVWAWLDNNTTEGDIRDTAFGVEAQTVPAQCIVHATVYFEEIV